MTTDSAPLVLIVDDDAAFRGLVATALEGQGLRVAHAGTGKAAEPLVDKLAPEVVIVDGLLPDGNGVALIERLRQKHPQQKVVFLSAFWRDSKTRHHLQSLQVTAVLHKPIEPLKIAEQVRSMCTPVAPPAGERPPPLPKRTPDPADIQRRLAEAAAQYRAALPSTALRLRELLDRLPSAPTPAEELKQVRQIAHQLHGTTGSMGMTLVSAAAAELEKLALEALAAPRPSGPQVRALNAALQKLAAAVASA